MKLRTWLMAAATLEVVTGIALFLSPPMVTRLLLAAEPAGTGIAIGRLCGVGLLSLGVACWPSRDGDASMQHALRGMLVYNTLAAGCLIFLRVIEGFAGICMWPAIVVHGALALFFAGAAWKAHAMFSGARGTSR